MNSTKKGDEFEARIFDSIKEMISEDRFFLKKECCRLYAKKGYFSKDRDADIIFDIAIEVYLPGKDTYSMLMLFECKNYSHSVPVNDVEEFYAKTQQISGANIKGVVASTGSFQSGAFTFAKSKGLGLLRYFDRSTLDWVLTRSPSSLISSSYITGGANIARIGITELSFQSDQYDFYCYANDHYTNSLNSFISTLTIDGTNELFNEHLPILKNVHNYDAGVVGFKKESQIESVSDAVLDKVGHCSGEVSLEAICSQLTREKGLRVFYHQKNTFGPHVLGRISFDPLEISIYSDDDENLVRARYTLAHELGHYFLGHSKYMKRELCKENDIDLEKPFEVGIKDIMKMEWQANFFASCLLLPKQAFLQDFLTIAGQYGLVNRGFGSLYLDNQRCNQNTFYAITGDLMQKYNVSRIVVKLRLKKLGLLNESFKQQLSPLL